MLGNDRVVGRWDRVDRTADGPLVIDYKSAGGDDDSGAPRANPHQDLQLQVYALAYERMYGTRAAKAALHFLETGQRAEMTPQPDALAAVAAVVTSTAAKIRARHFPAEPAKPEYRTCSQCPYVAICPDSWTARQVRAGTALP